MSEQTVLVVEDDKPKRVALQKALQLRGFSVAGAATVQEARDLVHALGKRLAVMVLDMRLNDPDSPFITGTDLGLEVRKQHASSFIPQRLPEFLIYSAWSLTEYYKAALELGVAAYLPKEETSQDLVIQHVRALLIRRNLQIEDEWVAERVAQIADRSQSVFEAALEFCEQVMLPVFTDFLGAPFVILVSDERRTRICPEPPVFTTEIQRAYENLEKLAYRAASADKPLNVDAKLMREWVSDPENSVLQHLLGAVFLPLPVSCGIRLCLGFLRSDARLSEEPQAMAKVLCPYLLRDVHDPLLRTLASHIKNKSRQDAALAARMLAQLAQKNLAILSEFEGASKNTPTTRELLVLAEKLRDTAQILMPLEGKLARAQMVPVAVAKLIEDVLAYSEDWLPRQHVEFTPPYDVLLTASKDDLFIAVTQVLLWFVQRRKETGETCLPWVKIEIAGPCLTFTDYSRRLARPLRKRLFSPFAQDISMAAGQELSGTGLYLPLYLAKVLVEVKHDGVLEDCSDEVVAGEPPCGHRFVMRFPVADAIVQ